MDESLESRLRSEYKRWQDAAKRDPDNAAYGQTWDVLFRLSLIVKDQDQEPMLGVRPLDRAEILYNHFREHGATDWLRSELEALEKTLLYIQVAPAYERELNRLENLPRGDTKYALWNRMADEIRKERPWASKKKLEIARIIRRRLMNDPDHRDDTPSADRISRMIE